MRQAGRTRISRARLTLAIGLALGLCGCEGDPKDAGLTGPFPDGIAPVTLTHAQSRHETSDDTPGVRADAGNNYTSTLSRLAGASKGGTSTVARRYYGYNH